MSYGRADTNPKVGYRPYHHSSPRRAASLSGLDGEAAWKLGQVRAFDPWILHKDTAGYARGLYGMDLGQVRPFDQHPGGWVLHGMGQDQAPESPAGTILIYTATLAPMGFITDADLSALGQLLSSNWNLSMQSSEITSRGMIGSPAFKLTVKDGIGHALAEDVHGVIDHEVSGYLGDITGSNIAILRKPGGGGGGAGDGGTPKDPTQWLMDNAIWIGLGIGAIVILPAVLSKIR